MKNFKFEENEQSSEKGSNLWVSDFVKQVIWSNDEKPDRYCTSGIWFRLNFGVSPAISY